MSSISTAVFKAAIGLLVNKGRGNAAEKLIHGDITDRKFRGLIAREIDNIKFSLDRFSERDLVASIMFFEEGIDLLYKVFEEARITSELDAATTQTAVRGETFSLAKRMKQMELTDLDETARRALSMAKERFKDCRRKATEAFGNETLKTTDCILAMQYRVMATILETVDNPEDALARCRVCIEELNSMTAVEHVFKVELNKGIMSRRFGKEERRKTIVAVCATNVAVRNVFLSLGSTVKLPPILVGNEEVDPLRDERVLNILRKLDIEFQGK